MITLQKLKWSNFFSYGENNELDFTESTVTQIIGVNGNGKSSIPLIIEEMIFNKNSKGIKKADIPNRYVNNGYWGELYFTVDEDEYLIRVDRKSTLKVKLFKNGKDISSHTATNTFKTIEELFGNDFKTTSQLVYQNTTNSLQFLTATDTTRKKFLIDLLQLDEYVELFELFKDAVKNHAVGVSNIEAQISTVEKWLAQNKLEDLTEREIVPVDDTGLVSDEREYAELGVKISSIEKTNKAINRNNQYKKLLAAINIDEINAIQVDPPQSYDEEQSKLGGLVSEKKRRTAYIQKMQKLGDSCPTCEQDIPTTFKTRLIDEETRHLEVVEDEIEVIEQKISSIKENNDKHKFKQERIREWEELFVNIDKSLPSEPINKEELSAELSNLAIRISNARATVKELVARNQEAAKINSRIGVYIEQAGKFEQELQELSTKLISEQATLSSLEVLKKSFSTNGLIAYKIENLVKDLEELTNEYLAELSDGRFTIEFSVSSDKLNVLITDNANTVDILALSSGELARVNTATLLALRKLMNSISKSEINILFLDEVIGVLDEPGKEKLVEVLLQENLNTFIVSHGWTHPLLNKLEIIKEDEISRIEHG